MTKNVLTIGLSVLAATFAVIAYTTPAAAQKKVEVCDDGWDNDDDKLVDCDDPDCSKDCKYEPPPEEPTGCSPGYYKNHLADWVGICCDDASDPTCADILSALTCKGGDAQCGRSAAASYLDECTGCSE